MTKNEFVENVWPASSGVCGYLIDSRVLDFIS